LVALTIQDLRPNPQDTSVFYLKNINQLLADPNVSRAAILATQAEPPPFSPPKSAIWVNSLWLLSLAISLTCALLATLLQQWARRYLTVTQPLRYSPHKRARIRAFFANGVEKYHLPWTVEALPTLLHLSLFLFFSGLMIFLFSINHTAFTVVACWVGLSAGIYGCITLMPIFCHDSPYYAPLSFTAWFLLNAVLYGVCGVFSILCWHGWCCVQGYPPVVYNDTDSLSTIKSGFHRPYRAVTGFDRILEGMVKTAQKSALNLSAKIDGSVLKWIFDSLDEDSELEQFFESIPGFCSSNVVEEPKRILAELGNKALIEASSGFMKRTCSSSLLPESVKERRVMLCIQAVDALDLPFPSFDFLKKVFVQPRMDGVMRSVPIGHSFERRCHSHHRETVLSAKGIVAGIIASVPERDIRWKTLVMAHLGISEDLLQHYLAHGDSVLLANLIYITRQLFRFDPEHWPGWFRTLSVLRCILPKISKFDIRNTLPALQNDFCALWNEITGEAHNSDSVYICRDILRHTRQLYFALHQDTDAVPTAFDASDDDYGILRKPSSYPLCNIPGHHPHTAPDEIAQAHSSSSLPHLPNVLLNSGALTAPDVSSSPELTAAYIRMHLTPDLATAIATERPSDTPLNSLTANSASGPRPATAASISTSPLRPTLRASETVDLQYNTDFNLVPSPLVPSNQPSSLPAPVPRDTRPSDPLTPSSFPVSQHDHITHGPGSLTPSSIPDTSFTAPREGSVSQRNLAPYDATFDMEVSQHPDRQTMQVLDIALGPLQHSLGTVPSSRDIDCPQ
jgi:Family of unknown function (DUF6535)